MRSKLDMATPVKTAFELIGADNLPLRGEVRFSGGGVGMPAVVISHGFKGFKDWGFFPHIASRLAGTGITVISFNFSGSGVGPDSLTFSEPERFRNLSYTNHAKDLDAIIDASLDGGLVADLASPTAIGLLGYSMGGAASIGRTARRPEVKSLATWSGISKLLRWDAVTVDTWRKNGFLEVVNARTGEVLELGTDILDDIERNGSHHDPLLLAESVNVPWLIVHCEGDETVGVGEAEALRKASKNAVLKVLAGGSHTFEAKHPWAGMTRPLDQAFELTVDHFVRTLV